MAVFVVLAACIFLADLWIKNQMEKGLREGEVRRLSGGKILLRKHHNRGMALNLGQTHRGAVAALSLVFTAALAAVFVLSLGQRGNNLLRAGLSLLLGGAFSNTYDRLRRRYVVDYLSFGVKWGKLRGLVFNLSDFCILIGALLVVLGAEG